MYVQIHLHTLYVITIMAYFVEFVGSEFDEYQCFTKLNAGMTHYQLVRLQNINCEFHDL